MGKHIDHTGERNGQRTVLGECGRDGQGNRVWRVRCDCGFLSTMRMSQFNNHKSCQDCATRAQRRMEIGTKKGTRTILAFKGRNRNKVRIVTVRCDCGRIDDTDVATFAHSTKCAVCAGAGRKRVYEMVPGTRYGNRVLIREDGRIGPHRAALCRCDCGKESRVEFASLRNGHTTMCTTCYRKEAGKRVGSMTRAECPTKGRPPRAD
jgi:hypothetical protein